VEKAGDVVVDRAEKNRPSKRVLIGLQFSPCRCKCTSQRKSNPMPSDLPYCLDYVTSALFLVIPQLRLW